MKNYSLRKSKKILFSVYNLLRRKKKKLSILQINEIKNDLKELQEQILLKNKTQANILSHKCEDYSKGILKKSLAQQMFDFFGALIFALAVALVIRQTWFELYEIPTGSMRPTFKEKDRLVVSKTDFGINIPFTTKHFYFDPNLVKRCGTIVFSAENIEIRDPDTLYFYLFPGKKQLVKRLMGKPGDILYFYGGQIYGIDANGKDISSELQLGRLHRIDHIPFIQFEGNVSTIEPFHSPYGNAFRMAILYQMNEPVSRLTYFSDQHIEGEMLYTPQIHYRNSPPIKNYGDLWGIKNYAIARIISKKNLGTQLSKNLLTGDESEFFLELKHNPSFNNLQLGKGPRGIYRPRFVLSSSVISLQEKHLKALFENIYTARFVVKNGFAIRYDAKDKKMLPPYVLTKMKNIPDGTYEFYYGEAYEIFWGGITKKLSKDHPLCIYSPKRVKQLFNLGIDFDKRTVSGEYFDTGRFGYFRNQDLYLLGSPIFTKEDPFLLDFVTRESQKSEQSLSYIPFIDLGPPFDKEGKLNVSFIRQYGLLIPPKMYLVLGDNYAMSADSRDFGFVPEGNLRGGPDFIFWPPSNRFGHPNQPSYLLFVLPRIIIWTIALICCIFWGIIYRKNHSLPLDL